MAGNTPDIRIGHRHWNLQHLWRQAPPTRGRYLRSMSLLGLLPDHNRHPGTGSKDDG
jgi:hypothetical protein